MKTLDDAGETHKLNILHLPSHTFVLFALIALVVLAAAFSSLLPGSQIFWPPIVLGMTLLPLRDFLRRPDRTISRWKMNCRQDEATAAIESEIASFEAGTLPRVVCSDRAMEAHAFGSFRRAYLGMGRGLAQALSAGLRASNERRRACFRAVLAHELAHFINRDVWLMWLSYALLKMMVVVMALNLWIGVSLALFVIENGPEVCQPEFWTALSQYLFPETPGFDLRWIYDAFYKQNPLLIERLADPANRVENWRPFFLNLVSAHWPVAASGLVLFLVYWRRLLRVRELYADARAASLMGGTDVVDEAQLRYGVLVALIATAPSRWERARRWLMGLPEHIPILGRHLALHPSPEERAHCLEDPARAFGSWQWIAVSVGLAVVMLDFLLRGTLTASYIYEPGPYLPFLTAFLVFAIWLLPRVSQGASLRRDLGRELVLIVCLFTVIKLVPHLADGLAGLYVLHGGNQETWGAIMDLWVYSLYGGFATEIPRLVGAEFSWLQIIEWHIVRPIAYFALLMPPTLIVFLLVDARLKQRALTWYRSEQRVRLTFWGISGVLALFLALVTIPIYNHLLFPHVYQSWSAAMLVGMVIAFAVLGIGGALFWNRDRRLARRCPDCNALIPGNYHLGKRCGQCDRVLHPWLIANY